MRLCLQFLLNDAENSLMPMHGIGKTMIGSPPHSLVTVSTQASRLAAVQQTLMTLGSLLRHVTSIEHGLTQHGARIKYIHVICHTAWRRARQHVYKTCGHLLEIACPLQQHQYKYSFNFSFYRKYQHNACMKKLLILPSTHVVLFQKEYTKIGFIFNYMLRFYNGFSFSTNVTRCVLLFAV